MYLDTFTVWLWSATFRQIIVVAGAISSLLPSTLPASSHLLNLLSGQCMKRFSLEFYHIWCVIVWHRQSVAFIWPLFLFSP